MFYYLGLTAIFPSGIAEIVHQKYEQQNFTDLSMRQLLYRAFYRHVRVRMSPQKCSEQRQKDGAIPNLCTGS